MNDTIIKFLPEADIQELMFLDSLSGNIEDDALLDFLISYKTRRRKPEIILILTAMGFLGVAGIQRLYVNNIFLGVLYVVTAGLCFIGTIVDLINHKEIARQYNKNIAIEIFENFRREPYY